MKNRVGSERQWMKDKQGMQGMRGIEVQVVMVVQIDGEGGERWLDERYGGM